MSEDRDDDQAAAHRRNELRRIGIHTCSICGEEYQGFGNNAEPVNPGRCCDECNKHVVIPVRLGRLPRDGNHRSRR